MKKERVVLFDGVCGLCNFSVNLLIRLDKHQKLKYSPLQGEFVKSIDIKPNIDSIVLYEEGRVYYKSTAILKVLRALGGVWIVSSVFYMIPRVIRDYMYDVVAKYRYRLFGKSEVCRMPKVEEKALFLA